MKKKFVEFKIVSKLKNKFYYDYLPRFTSILTRLSTRKARRLLKNKKTPKILVDTQILFHSISHVACEISTGKRMWGDIEIDTHMTARIPVDYDKREFESVKYLPSIVSLANQNLINLYSSFELRDEIYSQPPRRYRPMRIGGYSLMQDVDIKLFDDPDYKFDFGSWINEPHKTHIEQRLERLSKKKDPLYLGLLSVLGQKNSQDVWHIVTAENEGCYCLLTMDYKLIKALKAQKNNKFVKSLKTKVITPEQLGKEWELSPINHKLFSYNDANIPVRNDFLFKR